jgi:predicted nucleotidyltransferase component of viral defense system
MTLDTTQHKTLLIKILREIYTDQTVDQYLGFKGGTAAMLFYNLSRFSVDLDFDLLNSSKEEYAFEHLQKILQNFGTIKEARNKRYNLFFLLAYHNKLKDAQNIKVEVNKRNFGSRYETRQYLGIPMEVMTQEDMAANKMVAMYERIGKTNRDIYDTWFFLHNNWPVNQKIIETRTKLSYSEFLQACIGSLETMSDHAILSGIGELLDAKQKAWAKNHLRSETIFLLRLALEHSKKS